MKDPKTGKVYESPEDRNSTREASSDSLVDLKKRLIELDVFKEELAKIKERFRPLDQERKKREIYFESYREVYDEFFDFPEEMDDEFVDLPGQGVRSESTYNHSLEPFAEKLRIEIEERIRDKINEKMAARSSPNRT